MSWREQYQRGSFRGVAFRTKKAEERGGRRLAVHEFPGREQPWSEDITRTPRGYSFECFVVGDDYYGERDALIGALDAPGPGTLVHPFRGIMTIAVDNWTVSETADEGGGGIAEFTIEFVEAGAQILAPAAADTGAQARDAATLAQEAAPKEFGQSFSVENTVGFIQEASTNLVSGFVSAAKKVASVLDAVGQITHAVEAGALLLVTRIQDLARTPEILANQITGFVHTIGIMGSSAARLGGLFELLDFGGDEPDVVGDTPSRQRERANQDAILHLVHVVTAAELVRTIANTDFPSYQDAVALRDRAADRLDQLMLRAADRGDDEAADAYNALRDAMVRDVTARGGSLARLQQVTLGQTEPALVIAHRIYGGDVEQRSAEIVSRNRVPHPGFVKGGQPIEIISPGAVDG